MNAVIAQRDDGPLAMTAAQVAGPLARAPVASALVGAGLLAAGLAAPLRSGLVVVAALGFVVLAGAGAGRDCGRLGWVQPALLRAGEYGAALVLALRAGPDALPAVYGLLAAVAYHHYDVVYRQRERGVPPPRWLIWAGGGWDGRVLIVAALAASDALATGAVLLGSWCAVLFVGESVTGWLGEVRGGGMRQTGEVPGRGPSEPA